MDQYQSLAAQLDADADRKTRGLLHALLTIEADKRWDETTPVTEIREWVTGLRNDAETNLGDINANSCEHILLTVLTGDTAHMAGIPGGAITNLTALMAFKLVHDEGLGEAELQELLTEAEEVAAG